MPRLPSPLIRRPAGIAGREEVLRLAKAALRAGDPERARAMPAAPLRLNDPEGGLRRVCSHLGIKFEPAMLDFHANKRIVRTISAEQVRRPLNRDAIDEWRRFAPWLGPLEVSLGDAVDRWDDD